MRAEDLHEAVTPKSGAAGIQKGSRLAASIEEGAPLVKKVDADSRATLWALVRTYSTSARADRGAGFRRVFVAHFISQSAEKIQFLLTSGMTGW